MIGKGIAAGIVLAIFAIAAVSGTAVPYHAPVPRTDMTIHSYNISDSGANGVPLYTVTPVTSPYNYRGNAQMPRIVYQKSFVNTKRSNYTHWKPSVYPDNRWRVSKRFAPRTINPYKPYKPVIEPEEPVLTVLEKPDWEIGDWWIVNVSQYTGWNPINPSWSSEYSWKYKVVDIAEVNGKECFVVNVVEYPGDMNHLVLYYQKENLTLYQIDDGSSIILSTSSMIPFDFPVFPIEKNVTRICQIEEALLGSRYLKELKEIQQGVLVKYLKDVQQNVSVDTFTTRDGKTLECFKVSLQWTHQNVIQFWQPGAPWWVYEEKNGQVKAWLDDWGHDELKKKLQ